LPFSSLQTLQTIIDQSINQSTNPSTNQSINKSINQSINQFNQSTNQSTTQSIHPIQSINEFTSSHSINIIQSNHSLQSISFINQIIQSPHSSLLTCMPDKPGIIMELTTSATLPLAMFSFRNCFASVDEVKHIGKKESSCK
jgi:flagellar hook-basal body complex protein FliE